MSNKHHIPPLSTPRRWRILIADDEPTVTDTYAAAFAKSGIDTEKAYDGKECLEKGTASPFDLILVDIRMPGLDGYEVVKRLRLLPHLKYTPIVMLTGLGDSSAAIETSYSLGATEYWKKPVPTEELTARARALLRIGDAERKMRDMRESYTAMIVHDLRNPLGAIVGLAEVIAEDKDTLPPHISEMADDIRKSGQLMLNIISDFHDIARFESADVYLPKRATALTDVIKRGLEIHKSIRDHKAIAVSLEVDEIPPLMIDGERMIQVLDRVFDNAFRFTPPQGTIAIRAHAANGLVTLEIADSGPGIDDKDLCLLFDKMRIATPGWKREGSRTGLGLPICRAIVEAHGGTITARSGAKVGTTITITLPLQED